MFKFFAWLIFVYLIVMIVRSLLRPVIKFRINNQGNTSQSPPNTSYQQKKNGETFISGRRDVKVANSEEEDDGEYIDYKEVK